MRLQVTTGLPQESEGGQPEEVRRPASGRQGAQLSSISSWRPHVCAYHGHE